mgnify:CR=1 FL=1
MSLTNFFSVRKLEMYANHFYNDGELEKNPNDDDDDDYTLYV